MEYWLYTSASRRLDEIEVEQERRGREVFRLMLQNGYPIASGSAAGACKNLVKDRMERSGMRWTPPMAEAVLRLRAVCLSDHFEDYWRYHVDEDQKRLYQSTTWRKLVAKK